LNYVPGMTLVEMSRNRERNFCCGGGGGHLWLEEQKVGERINVMRVEQALDTEAQIVATACRIVSRCSRTVLKLNRLRRPSE